MMQDLFNLNTVLCASGLVAKDAIGKVNIDDISAMLS